jgi:arsenate reductase
VSQDRTGKTRVLFVCTQNTGRSQMAEAFLRVHGGQRFDPHSAGLVPGERDPLVAVVMRERGISLAGQRPKSIDEYRGRVRFDYVITVCSRAERRCPAFAGMGMRLTWPFEDPAVLAGDRAERLAKYREVRDAIERFITGWLRTMASCDDGSGRDDLGPGAVRCAEPNGGRAQWPRSYREERPR